MDTVDLYIIMDTKGSLISINFIFKGKNLIVLVEYILSYKICKNSDYITCTTHTYIPYIDCKHVREIQ